MHDRIGDGIRDRIEQPGASRQKIIQCALLFFVMLFIYRHYVMVLLKAMIDSGGEPIDAGEWLTFPLLLKFFLMNGWAFAALAFFDKEWRSADAAKVAIAAFLAGAAAAIHHYGLNQCPKTIVLSVPFLAAAAVGHAIGAWKHPAPPVRFDDD